MAKKRKLKKKAKRIVRFLIFIAISLFVIDIANYYYVLNKELTPVEYHKDYYYASDFGINVIKSEFDYDEDGIDDYTDILLGAQKERDINPKYNSSGYYDGGYPPDDEGVCTDTIWRALKEAGYLLKDMINYDIKVDQEEKTNYYNISYRDSNIDFRRVGNQEVFFDKYAESLTTNIYKFEEFMPGDILIFNYGEHIALVSDKRNASGIPYLIQNRDETQEEKEEDRLEITDMKVTGHYRFTQTREIKLLMEQALQD